MDEDLNIKQLKAETTSLKSISSTNGNAKSKDTFSASMDASLFRKQKSLGNRFGKFFNNRKRSEYNQQKITPNIYDQNKSQLESFQQVCESVLHGITEYLEISTKRLDTLQAKSNEEMNTAKTYEYNRKINHLERMREKLKVHRMEIKELLQQYEYHYKYKQGAKNLKTAMASHIDSSNASLVSCGIIGDVTSKFMVHRQKMMDIEQQLEDKFLGELQLKMKGLLGYARLKSGDIYELSLRHGKFKWKSRGQIMTSSLDQSWENYETKLIPKVFENINIKLDELGMFNRKQSSVGAVTLEVKDLFKTEEIVLNLPLNEAATLKLDLLVSWKPFDTFQLNPPASPTTRELLSGQPGNQSTVMTTPIRLHMNTLTNQASHDHRILTSSSRRIRPIRMVNRQPMWKSANSNNNNNKGMCLASSDLKEKIKSGYDSLTLKSTNTTDVLLCDLIHKQMEKIDFNKLEENDADFFVVRKENSFKSKKAKLLSEMTDKQRHQAELLTVLVLQINYQMSNLWGKFDDLHSLEKSLFMLNDILKFNQEEYNCQKIKSNSFDEVSEYHFILGDEKEVTVTELLDNTDLILTTSNCHCDEALVVHLSIILQLLKKVGVFGPLRVQEVRNLDNLYKQGKIIMKIVSILNSMKFEYEDLGFQKELLEFWKSCCQGNFSLTTSGKILRLELELGYGMDVRLKHYDVAHKVFPELVRRIIHCDITHIDDVNTKDKDDSSTVTLFQLNEYFTSALELDGCDVTIAKLIDLLSYELFINTALTSNNKCLVLSSIKNLSSLLAMRISNLNNLAKLLLNNDEKISSSAAAHIKFLKEEDLLREKAIIFYAELLESSCNKVRKSACLALGFLHAEQLIPQLSYIIQTDTHPGVRKTAADVLLSFGKEGEIARQNAESSLFSQTMSQQILLNNKAASRLGTLL